MNFIQWLAFNLFTKRTYRYKWEWSLMAVIMFTAGISFSLFILTEKIILPRIFAATSPWTQTDWSGGSASGTVTDGVDTYSSISNLDTSVHGQTLLQIENDWSGDYLSWTKRKEMTVTNVGVGQTNYSVKLTVTYDSDMQSDFDDLRFTNSSGTPLDYWLESKTDSTTAIVWVEIDTLDAGDTVVYQYYGNALASSGSSGVNTFPFFDDFNDNVFDTAKWVEVDPRSKISESGGKLMFTYGSGNGNWDTSVYAIPSFPRGDYAFEWDMRRTSAYSPYNAFMFGWKDDGPSVSYTNLVYGYYIQGDGSCTTCATMVYEDGGLRGGVTGTWVQNTDYKSRVRMRASGGAFYEKSTNGGASWSLDYTSGYSTESTLHPAWMFYSGDHEVDNAFVRKWMATEPTSAASSEESKYPSTGTLTSNIFDAGYPADWGEITYTTSGSGTVTVKVRSDTQSDMSTATDWTSCSGVASGSTLSDSSCVDDEERYFQYQVTLEPSGGTTPVFEDITINFAASDQIAPSTQASSIVMSTAASGGTSIVSYESDDTFWTREDEPYIEWTAGADNGGGSGILGYCVYVGMTEGTDPRSSKGILGTSPVETANTDCAGGFIISTNSLDLATDSYRGVGWMGTSGEYYVYITAIDNSGNAAGSPFATFHYQYDGDIPTNVSYISAPSIVFGNVADMSFSWPISGGGVSGDTHSGVLGWQYSLDGGGQIHMGH